MRPVAASMKLVSAASSFETYSVLPSGERSNASGSSPSGMRRSDRPPRGSITSAWFESVQATSSVPSGARWMWRARLHVAIVPFTASVAVSISVSASSFSLVT